MRFVKNISKVLLLIVLATATQQLTAATSTPVKVESFQNLGVEANKAEVVKGLVIEELSQYPEYKIAGDKEKTDLNLKGSLTRLENVYLLRLSFAGSITRSKQVRLASFDEVDTAVKRAVKALVKNVELESTATEGTTLNQDDKARSRVTSLKGWEVGLGIGGSNNKGALGKNSLWAFNLGYAWDVKDVFLELRWDVAGSFDDDGKSAFNSFTIGAQYVFKNFDQTSLFAGGEFGIGGVSDTSFAFAGDLGALFLRHADINLETRLRVATLAKKQGDDRWYSTDQKKKQTVLTALIVGLRF